MGMNATACIGYGIDLGEADHIQEMIPKLYEILNQNDEGYEYLDWDTFVTQQINSEDLRDIDRYPLDLHIYCCDEVMQYALLIKNSIISADWSEGTTFNHLPVIFPSQIVDFIKFCTKWDISNKNPSWLLLARYW